jgi:putative solute:sodium symporter small subunit
MADDGSDKLWRKTRMLALAMLIVTVVVVVILVGAGALEQSRETGFPFGYVLATLVAPAFLVGIVFWFARRQESIDRQYGYFED